MTNKDSVNLWTRTILKTIVWTTTNTNKTAFCEKQAGESGARRSDLTACNFNTALAGAQWWVKRQFGSWHKAVHLYYSFRTHDGTWLSPVSPGKLTRESSIQGRWRSPHSAPPDGCDRLRNKCALLPRQDGAAQQRVTAMGLVTLIIQGSQDGDRIPYRPRTHGHGHPLCLQQQLMQPLYEKGKQQQLRYYYTCTP